MPSSSDTQKEAKRKIGFLLSESAADALNREAHKRRCWPNRVIEDLIQEQLVKSESEQTVSARSA